eukprot:c39166_g1_i1.p1 GENE.c39166_g1_i1~~c39166_g1_i1.p1  ORF type:complete len:348 (-),score=38.33 c39166_g1_i1:9-1052(-)
MQSSRTFLGVSVAAAAVAALAAALYTTNRRRTVGHPPLPLVPVVQPPEGFVPIEAEVKEQPAMSSPAPAPASAPAEAAAVAVVSPVSPPRRREVIWNLETFNGEIMPERSDALIWSAGLMSGFKPHYYACDSENDTGWGCGHRCIQSLVWQLANQQRMLSGGAADTVLEVPRIAQILTDLATLPAAAGEATATWGEWLAVDSMTRYLGHFHGLANCRMVSLTRMAQLEQLAEDLRDHFLLKDLLVVAEGTGQLFMLGGVRCVAAAGQPSYDLFVVDPHGPPRIVGAGVAAAAEMTFHGEVGWVTARALLVDSSRTQLAQAFPGQAFTDDEILQHIGGWRLLLLSRDE